MVKALFSVLSNGWYYAVLADSSLVETSRPTAGEADHWAGSKIEGEEFEKRKAALKEAVYELAETCEKESEDDIDGALRAVHDRFEELNRLLR